jgi:DNA-binding CsgD family transcriptional regulator
LQLELAEHLYLASDFHRAAAVLAELRAALEPGDLRARVLILLADIDYWRSGESAALELAEQALVDARDPLTQARCNVAIAMYAGTVDLAKAAVNGRAAVALLESLAEADSGLLAAALGAMVRAELFLGNGFEAETATRALALEQNAPLAAVDTRIVFKLGQWLRYVDDFDGARRQMEQAETQARDEGDDSSLANILLNRVILATWSGAIAEAAELAERMIDAFAQLGLEMSGANVWKTYVDAYAGRVDTVRAAAARADTQEPIVAALWERAIGLAELAAGEIGAADRHLSRALGEFDRIDFREPAIWRVDGDAIEAAAAVGDLERAERWLARFEERAARSQIPWSLAVSARCRGLVLAGQGTLEQAADALGRALKEHERCPMPFEHARTLLVHGQVLRRLKRKREARTSLEAAAALFERLGTEPWVAHAASELRRVAARRAPSELTATERTIAELAASGLSNPEIAGRVFVSRKTVESNLARVYRKLGISSRGRLEEALRKDGLSIP